MTRMTDAVSLYGQEPGRSEEATLARIERGRDDAAQELARTRDIAAWQATMSRLDLEAEAARQPQGGGRAPPRS